MLIFLQKNNVGSDTVVVSLPTFIIEPIFFDVVNCVKLIMQISLIHIAFDYTYM